jgi:hypothetical protein
MVVVFDRQYVVSRDVFALQWAVDMKFPLPLLEQHHIFYRMGDCGINCALQKHKQVHIIYIYIYIYVHIYICDPPLDPPHRIYRHP